MTLRVFYIACITMLGLLSIYYMYWGIASSKYRTMAKNEKRSFCMFMYRLTEDIKWEKRDIGFGKKFYNGNGYSIFYEILAIVCFILTIVFVIFLVKMNSEPLGAQLLDFNLFTK